MLVGGIALVIRGSRRDTQDFDVLVSCRELDSGIVKEICRLGYELIAKLSPEGGTVGTIDRPEVAAARADRGGNGPDVLRVAAPKDLLKLKEIAYADRKSAADAQDLEFLRNPISAGA